METYFDAIPYDILIIIASKLRGVEFNNFIDVIDKDVLTDNFYKDLIITAFNIFPKRNYNWKNIYEGLLSVLNSEFTINDIKKIEHSDDYKVRKCLTINKKISDNLNLSRLDIKYKEKYCDNLINKLTFEKSYNNDNYELLSFLTYENIYNKEMHIYLKIAKKLANNYVDVAVLNKVIDYIEEYVKINHNRYRRTYNKIINPLVLIISTNDLDINYYEQVSLIFQKILDLKINLYYEFGRNEGDIISIIEKIYNNLLFDNKHIDLYIYLFDKLILSDRIKYLPLVSNKEIMNYLLKYYNL
jgi:hypothetical protein